MCGFVGFTGMCDCAPQILTDMCAAIAHRGPDATGQYTSPAVSLGHVRLSILDTAPRANQPMTSADNMVHLVYNGEIYNEQMLRKELVAEGYAFTTSCDTEVLLAGYLKWGTDVVRHLRGMFAFVIYDRRTDTLFGGRDPFGIKPLYYTFCNRELLFASEYKAFLKHPDFRTKLREDALLPFLTFQYNPQDETFLSGVFRLPPGQIFLWKNHVFSARRYADLRPSATGKTSVDLLHETISASVALHTHSDVPVGAFLSGGVDSGYLVALSRPERVFSVGFDAAKFDESHLASDLCKTLRLSHNVAILDEAACLSALSDIQYHMDDPQANPSAIPLFFLAKEAAKSVKVVLSGEGADELFAGYDGYGDTHAASLWKRLPSAVRHSAATLAWTLPRGHFSDLALHGSDPCDGYIGHAYLASPAEARALLQKPYKKGATPCEITAPYFREVAGEHPLLQKQYVDLNLWLPCDILQKADKMTMAHSLELRVPFLDTAVFAAASNIPVQERRKGTCGKLPLRAAAERVLPTQVAQRQKKGFPVPIQDFLRAPLGVQICRAYFESEQAAQYFSVPRLKKIYNAHLNGVQNGRLLYAVLSFLLWEERFLQSDIPKLHKIVAHATV